MLKKLTLWPFGPDGPLDPMAVWPYGPLHPLDPLALPMALWTLGGGKGGLHAPEDV